MTRILYDYQIFAHQCVGGVSRYFVELLLGLEAHSDIEPWVIAGFSKNALLKRNWQRLAKGLHGVSLPRWFSRSRLPAPASRFFFNATWRRAGADIYHPTYYRPLAYDFSGKRVVTVYDMVHERFPLEVNPRDRTVERKRRCVEQADAVICLSQSTARDLREFLDVPEERIRVICLGAAPATGEDPVPRTVPSPYLLYVGMRGGYKNFGVLLDALHAEPAVVRHVRLVCFGGGAPDAAERERIRTLGLSDSVDFLEGGDELLHDLYRHAEVLVYPSRYEGFGLPVAEAMAQGCPVICSNTSSLPEVGGDAVLYFAPSDAAELAARIQPVLSDTALRADLVRRGRERAAQFSWDRTARETVSLYRELDA